MSAGRPAMYGEKMRSVTMRLPESLCAKAIEKAQAKGEGHTISEIVRRLLEKYAKRA